MLGLDGIEIGLIIVFICLFGGILSGFPVAFAIGGAGLIAFGIIAALDSAGLLIHQAINTSSDAYRDLVASGINPNTISIFRYPDLPRIGEPVFPQGWEVAMDRNVSFIVNRINERVLAGQSIETLLAVLMFVLMGITLERSKIANDLLTTMARVFGPLPGGLAVSIVVVGAFLAASTGIVGATVVTMGLLALPTMLRNNYSPEIATGVIAASGTLGQIIPPSIVIVLLGTLAGDLYATAQEARAQEVGCSDALTYLGEPAVLSVGTLFQAALLPGILLALLYAVYAFTYALINPSKAPAVPMGAANDEPIAPHEIFTWFIGAPIGLIAGVMLLSAVGVVGSQDITVSSFSDQGEAASLRTNVSPECKDAMIQLHGQDAWDAAVMQQGDIDASGGVQTSERLNEEQLAQAQLDKIANAAPIGTGIAVLVLLMSLILTTARGISPSADVRPLLVGGLGAVLVLVADIVLVRPDMSSGVAVLIWAIPMAMLIYGCVHAVMYCARNELIRVVFPPLVLIVAVLGSILGGITNPTPAAALGAGGAIMLAAYRKLRDQAEDHHLVDARHRDLPSGRRELRSARQHRVGEPGILDRLLHCLCRISLRALRAAVLLLGSLRFGRADPRGTRDGQGHVDGLHDPDRVAASEPRGHLLWRGTLHPAMAEEFRQRIHGLPDRDAGAFHPRLRSRLPRDHLHRDPHRRAGDLWRIV